MWNIVAEPLFRSASVFFGCLVSICPFVLCPTLSNQNYFTKAAQIIIQSRIPVSPVYTRGTAQPKVNKWFNIELEETDNFREDLRLWRQVDIESAAIPPLVVETYLDLRHLSPQQTFIQVTPSGETVNVPRGRTEVVLERWVVDFSVDLAGLETRQMTDLPIVYKRAIILLRSLYAYSRLIPSWKLKTRLTRAKLNVAPISIGCRILNGMYPISSKGRVGLTKALYETKDSYLDTFEFDPVDTPAGSMRISVSYRTNTDFRVSDSEALLSTHFLSLDESSQQQQQQQHPYSATMRFNRNSLDSASSGSYVSQLRKASIKSSSEDRAESSTTVPTAASTSVTSTTQNVPTRPAVSFIQPFKSPSLSASPGDNSSNSGFPAAVAASSSPRATSFTRIPSNSSLAAFRRPRSTSNASISSSNSYAKSVSNTTAGVADNIVSSSTSSGSSIPKFSSSFGSRSQWPKVSSVTGRRPYIGEPSSVGSTSSSPMEPGSGLYLPSNDIGDFVKMVDSTKHFDPRPNRSLSGSTSINSPTTSSSETSNPPSSSKGNPLTRFQMLKSIHTNLSDSLQSSMYMNKPPPEYASGSSGNYYSPATTAHLSTSSSPLTRGMQHTPFIPSRLSEEFTADHSRERPSAELRKPSLTGASHDRPYVNPSSPLDIPMQYSKPRRESLSVSNRRTSGYEDMHANMDLESHHQSLSKNIKIARPRSFSVRNRLSYYLQEDDSTDKISKNQQQQQAQSFEDDDLLFAMSDMHMTSSSGDDRYEA